MLNLCEQESSRWLKYGETEFSSTHGQSCEKGILINPLIVYTMHVHFLWCLMHVLKSTYYIYTSTHQAPSAWILGLRGRGRQTKKNPTVLLKQLVPSLQRQVENMYNDFYGTDIWFLLGTDVLVNLLFWYVPVESDGEVYHDWIPLFYRPCFAPSPWISF